MAMTDLERSLNRKIDSALETFCEKVDRDIDAPPEEVLTALQTMGAPDFADAWGDYVEESGE